MRRPLVVGNWKMNGSAESSRALVETILGGLKNLSAVDVAVCPPFIYLPQVAAQISGSSLKLGGQNLSHADKGAYTGEVSGHMLLDVGAELVIVGHSERRSDCGEDDARVAEKYLQALSCQLVPILCVGETLAERDQGATLDVIERQLAAVLAKLEGNQLQNMLVAYEPVWAIGTGKTATPGQAQEVHAFIRQQVAGVSAEAASSLRILYGGSVNAGNAASLFAQTDIDGGLVGGASLDAGAFLEICRAAAD